MRWREMSSDHDRVNAVRKHCCCLVGVLILQGLLYPVRSREIGSLMLELVDDLGRSVSEVAVARTYPLRLWRQSAISTRRLHLAVR